MDEAELSRAFPIGDALFLFAGVSRSDGLCKIQGTAPQKKNTALQDRRKILSGETAAKQIGCVAGR